MLHMHAIPACMHTHRQQAEHTWWPTETWKLVHVYFHPEISNWKLSLPSTQQNTVLTAKTVADGHTASPGVEF